MVLMMKNFDILWVKWKIQLLEGSRKTTIEGEIAKKGGWTVCQFEEGISKKEGGGVILKGVVDT